MRLNKENVIKILSQNFNTEVIEHPIVGPVVKLSALKAYFYSAVTGHTYLNEPIYSFSPNGLMRVFNQANAYNLVTGLFDRYGRLHNTPLIHTQRYPFLLNEPKYLLPLEHERTHRTLQEKQQSLHSELSQNGVDPSDFVVCRINLGVQGYHMEAFCEYVVSEYFNQRGYLTETQIPFYYSGGTPDLAAYEVPSVIGHLKERALMSKGFSFIELAALRTFGIIKEPQIAPPQTPHAIVGEAKTASLRAAEQIQKYLSFGVFNKAYEIIPHKTVPEVVSGLICFDDEGLIQVHEAKRPVTVSEVKQTEYLSWLSNYIKYFLLANLSNDELDEWYGTQTGQVSRTVSQFIQFVNTLDYEQLLSQIQLLMVKR